jgi:hypothetical protein
MPEGYVRYDDPNNPITQIEVENKSINGNRFERWIPIQKIYESSNLSIKGEPL